MINACAVSPDFDLRTFDDLNNLGNLRNPPVPLLLTDTTESHRNPNID
jgi:hypothetical protein